VYPPSEISQFGFNFVAHAKWLFYVSGANAPGVDDETVSLTHSLIYWTGTHTGNPGPAPSASAQIAVLQDGRSPIETIKLNLPVLALNPIRAAGAGNGAVIGFTRSEFAPGTGSAQGSGLPP
jgi:hypothetical protein